MKIINYKKTIATSFIILFATTSNNIVAHANFDPDDQGNIYTVQSRLRELGYFNYRPTATFGEMTKSILNTFRAKNSIGTSSLLDETTYNKLFENTAIRKSIPDNISLPIGPQSGNNIQGGSAKSFSDINNSFKVGDTVTIYDYITGNSITVKRTGGENHIVAELSGSNTNDLKAIFGNTFTWEKRSAVAIINNERVAAAISVFQNDSGVKVLVYFTGSASDISGTLDVEYAAKILQAVQ